jgi:NAD(P)-dependent dehydrogenase (short-subunit alcohol dehydrogenase family)
MLLADSTAVVTGAASPRGIGYAVARIFAEHGARVALLDIDGAAARAAAETFGPQHRGYTCDVTSQESIAATFAQIEADLGPARVLVNNAGVSSPKKLEETTQADYDRIMDVNLRGGFLCSQAVVPQMRRLGGGSIICMSSVSAKRGGGLFGASVYSAAKAGLLGLTRALARELAPARIRVNALAPGLIDTDIFGGQLTPERRAAIIADVPLGRVGTPLDVARACLFFASELSDFVTGEVMDVNGGLHID